MKAIAEIRKKYGRFSIHKVNETLHEIIPVIPTGSFELDLALNVGGIPLGRIVEIFGPESSGKTTLCQHIIANCQSLGGKAAFIDVEHSLDESWLITCGVDVNELYISQPDYAEMALDMLQMLLPDFDLIVLDSVAGLSPKAEIQGEIGDSHMGLTARLMSQSLRKIVGEVKKTNTTVIFTNQLRDKIGVVWGSPETTTGGNALKFYSSIRLDIRRRGTIKQADGSVIGNETKVTVKKNKVGPPFKIGEFTILYDEGISRVDDLIKFGINNGAIEKNGAWFTIGDVKLQGINNLRDKIKTDTELAKKIEDQIRLDFKLPLRG